MGIKFAPIVADLYLFSYEIDVPDVKLLSVGWCLMHVVSLPQRISAGGFL